MDNSFKMMQKLNREIKKEIRKYKRQLFLGSVFPIFSIDEALPGIAIIFKTIIDILFLITASLSITGNKTIAGLYLFFTYVTGGISTLLTSLYYKWAKEDITYNIKNIKQEVLNKYNICENISKHQQNTENKELEIKQTKVKTEEAQTKKTTSIAPIIHGENNKRHNNKTRVKKIK